MPKPALVAVDDVSVSRELIDRELATRYGHDYSVFVEPSASEGLRRLRELAAAGDEVALVLADHWMPEMTGPELLVAARTIHPRARRGLLIEWGADRAARQPIMQAVALGAASYYVAKPVHSPDERFHRAITEFLDEWWRQRGGWFEMARVIGDPSAARSHEICDLLGRNDIPYGFYDPVSKAGAAAVTEAGIQRLPAIILFNGRVLEDPTNRDVGAALGAKVRPGMKHYDLAIVGGGPAGLAAAVYATSEGLDTVLLEREALGGQAGTSSLIRNYLGFPRGVSGAELAARAFEQARLFGAEIIYGASATSLRADETDRIIELDDGSEVVAAAVVIATGVSYRRLGVSSLEALVGSGVFYGAAVAEAQGLQGEHVCVVGGGNSAGQAATYLSRYAARVTVVVRGLSLASSMSEYLIAEIDNTPNIAVRHCVEVVGGGGAGHLEHVVLRDRSSGTTESVEAAALFVLIGAEPFTQWLDGALDLDDGGYVLTGGRDAALFETSMSGVFAVGDVRHGSVKRVASAVGDGSVCIRLVHDRLAGMAGAIGR